MAESAAQPTAAMIVIGDEILSGRIQEKNAHRLAIAMEEIGVKLREVRVISDDHAAIVAAVNALRAEVDYVFTSGGIGPTHDDITADAVAAAFGSAIGVRADARAILEAYYPEGELTDARLRMARIPDGAELIDNPVSRAPGFRIGNVHVMAGVPAIFNAMLDGLKNGLAGGPKTLTRTLRVALPESKMAPGLGSIAEARPMVSIGVYPYYLAGAGPGATVVLRSIESAALAAAADEVTAVMRGLGAEPMEDDHAASR